MLKWINIDCSIITRNATAIKKALKPGVKFTAVVKANGYGHGAAETATAALRGGADRLAVLTAEEGAALRKKFPDTDIMLLAPSLPEEAEFIIQNRLVPCVCSSEFLESLNSSAEKNHGITTPETDIFRSAMKQHKYPYTLEIDSGMGRWGIPADEFSTFLRGALEYKNLYLAGTGTHIGYRPTQNMTYTSEKLKIFGRLSEEASRIAGRHIEACAANSSVFCDFPDSQFDAVRTGNLLYGIYPTDFYRRHRQGPPLPGLERPWQFHARIIALRNVKKGERFGYNAGFTADRDMRLASIPTGYSDGLTMEPAEYQIRLSAGFRYWGIINGHKAYFAGKPGISHTMLDVTDIPGVSIGTEVALHVRRTSANILIPRVYSGLS
ncbi:MAG: alanine racemase [Elusimicrobiales bacterium]|nr:alanine racemase [Elusimicrobiales bacterium]